MSVEERTEVSRAFPEQEGEGPKKKNPTEAQRKEAQRKEAQRKEAQRKEAQRKEAQRKEEPSEGKELLEPELQAWTPTRQRKFLQREEH
ncbi:hypothetical protein K3495_g16182 [Podosphaera aphanis]|nr:hypothetical protein K3495_g16182 [Podosphaera aphanis]